MPVTVEIHVAINGYMCGPVATVNLTNPDTQSQVVAALLRNLADAFEAQPERLDEATAVSP